MTICTSAVLIVGCLGKELDSEMVNDWLDNRDLEYASLHFDAAPDECIIGIVVANDDGGPIDMPILSLEVEEAKAKFFTLTGQIGELHVCPNVTMKSN